MKNNCFWDTLSAEELIEQMYAHTDADSTLYMPDLFSRDICDETPALCCKMHWEADGCEKVLQAYRTLRSQLEQLASVYEKLGDTEEENCGLLSEDLLSAWRTYLRPFETENFDFERIADISDRLDAIADVRALARQIAEGHELSPEEIDFLNSYTNEQISEDEQKEYEAFREILYADCARRIGSTPFAYRQVIHARRLCRLLELRAPQAIVDKESRALAAAMVLHRYCTYAGSVHHPL